jgi:hypothetical protein
MRSGKISNRQWAIDNMQLVNFLSIAYCLLIKKPPALANQRFNLVSFCTSLPRFIPYQEMASKPKNSLLSNSSSPVGDTE